MFCLTPRNKIGIFPINVGWNVYWNVDVFCNSAQILMRTQLKEGDKVHKVNMFI
jgi:hypothetical protein